MARPRQYLGARETISPKVDSELLRQFDKFAQDKGSSRNEEIQLAMKSHMDDDITESKADIIKEYAIDMQGKFCEQMGVSVINDEVINLNEEPFYGDSEKKIILSIIKLLGEVK